jgi:hypothetical protein
MKLVLVLAANVLFVNFAGDKFTQGSPDNAPSGVSQLTGTQIPPFDATTVAPLVSAADAEEAILDRIRGYFAPYNLTVTAARPAAAPYSELVIGGTPSLLGQTPEAAGAALVDCGNLDASNVAFDFPSAPLNGGAIATAIAGAHEAGHSFGLEHVDNPADVMFNADPASALWQTYFDDYFALAFTKSGNYSGFNGSMPAPEQCGRANPLDDDALLTAALGASVGGDRTAPVLTWSAPAAGTIPLHIDLALAASDDVGVKKIEIYRLENGIDLIAVLRAPPYSFGYDASDGENFALVVEAVDAAGNRASEKRAFIAAAPPDLSAPDDGAIGDDAGTTAGHHGGCSFAD